MKTEVKLIKGYILNADRAPDRLAISSPYMRFAVVTQTYQSETDEDSIFVDANLLANVLQVICGEDEKDVELASDSEALSIIKNPSWKYIEELISNWQFRSLVTFSNNGPRVQIFEVPYFKVGGPEPYHDSATLEIFAPVCDYETLWESVLDYFSKHSIEPTIIEGAKFVPPQSIWRRFF